ncbi:MAG: hypothetical protein AAFR20_00570 [Pseudomonadota bacterium]
MTKNTTWTPDRETALRAVIRDTLKSAGDIPPDQLPHHVRQRLRDQVDGSVDLDTVIASILAEEKAKR